MRHKLAGLRLFLTPLAFLLGTAPAWGDHVDLGGTCFDCLGEVCRRTSRHDDADPFRGSITLRVTNTGTESWGDFHFEFFQIPPDGDPVDNVHWEVSSGYEPTMNDSSTDLSWAVDNVVVGATLDLFFYSNSVDPSQTVTFVVYSDNIIESVPFFGTAYYPTPIPEPGTFWLLGAGLIGMARFRERG